MGRHRYVPTSVTEIMKVEVELGTQARWTTNRLRWNCSSCSAEVSMTNDEERTTGESDRYRESKLDPDFHKIGEVERRTRR